MATSRNARRSAVRRPPKPFAGQPSRCFVCGRDSRFATCGPDCESTWRLATDRRIQRAHLLALFGDTCWRCGDEPGSFIDHVRPLWSLGAIERGELRWWLPSNLQLLGPACHRAKTAREARERAALRRPRPLASLPYVA